MELQKQITSQILVKGGFVNFLAGEKDCRSGQGKGFAMIHHLWVFLHRINLQEIQ
jgi:hypothetical protein